MKLKSLFAAKPQPAATRKPAPATTRPQELGPQAQAQVAGGLLPRGGGGWVSTGTVETDQLPRGGGGW
jgi:hypothetical protein